MTGKMDDPTTTRAPLDPDARGLRVGLRRRAGRAGRDRVGPVHPRHRAARRAAPALVGRRAGLRCAPSSASSTSASAAAPTRFSLADLPFVFGLVFATGDDVRARRAGRHRRRLRPDPPPGARQAHLQPRPARARRDARRRRAAARRRQRRRAPARDLGRPVRRDAVQRRAHDPAARRRDRDRRGQRARPDAGPDVRHRRARDADQRVDRDRRRARRRHRPARRPGAARPGPDRLRRLPRLHLRAPAPRAAGVPLRREPHALPLPRGRRGARGAARPLARSLQRRRRRGAAVHRRRRAAAHDPRPRRPPRDDGARRPRDRRGALRPRRRRARPSSASPRPSAPRTCAPACRPAASATR